MKALFLAILISSFCLTADAGTIFREVHVWRAGWRITFHEKGERYRIEIDGVDRGISGYLQVLRLKKGEKLRLVARHSHLDLAPGEKEGKSGLKIVKSYRERMTGKAKTKKSFVENHDAEPQR